MNYRTLLLLWGESSEGQSDNPRRIGAVTIGVSSQGLQESIKVVYTMARRMGSGIFGFDRCLRCPTIGALILQSDKAPQTIIILILINVISPSVPFHHNPLSLIPLGPKEAPFSSSLPLHAICQDPHRMVHGIGMQQHSNSPQSMHGVPRGLLIVSVVLEGFILTAAQ